MSYKRVNTLFHLQVFVAGSLMLNGCSSSPEATVQDKRVSPWEQREQRDARAQATETFKADLKASDEVLHEIELSQHTEAVDETRVEIQPIALTEHVIEVAEEEQLELTPLTLDEAEVVSTPEPVSIMDQPAEYFTMQLMASVDIDRVIRFADENQIVTQYVVATERGGVVWYVLLLDVYTDYESAAAARDEIAPRLKNAPWIRKVGAVQALVR